MGRKKQQEFRFELADLAGPWRLDRVITDRRLQIEGCLTGRSLWRDAGAARFEQTETGILYYGTAAPMAATRRYFWRAQGRRIAVSFSDGGAFHDFLPRPECQAEHLCGDDLYRVRYDFSRWPNWSTVWQVTGPRKELMIESRFSPEPSDQ